MTITQLRAFVAAVDGGSFTAAADALGVSQPTVSALIRKLEEHHRLPLFIRTGRRLTLTAAGSELLAWARQIVETAERADEALVELRGVQRGTISLGVLRNANFYFLPDMIELFHRARPNVQLRLFGQNSFEVVEGVREGVLEAGIVVLPVPDDELEVFPLIQDEVLWASASPDHVAQPVTIDQVVSNPVVLYDVSHSWNDPTRRQLSERAQERGLRLEPQFEVEYLEAALELVSRGLGDTMVSRAVTRSAHFPDGIHVAPFETPMYDTIAVIRRRNSILSPAILELIDIVSALLRQRAPRIVGEAPPAPASTNE
ncbi:LysR family transcriptional regulator [Leucobacter viscericola]|uniref:LysR family transcriptional regulator n=1 Tax=Leucobacter viscericola TaxID=2714935 RepID=A0A6G7XEP4_9MICO|nr:LysR family transcriptional regulator [Leucobacter viscericola]QIK63064.1 LysR family transcriptional regulator [Leucobacter viscericola]